MKIKILCLLLPFGVLGNLNAQNVVKLPATTVIGTDTSVDYNNGNIASTTVNTKNNLFDDDLTTFFAAHQRTGGWAGLDLGTKHVITKVAYCPREGQAVRLLLGVFEGANSPDFLDAVPLCIVTATPPQNTMTEQLVECSRGFRYVRYVGPNDVRCNIAEIAFYGYQDAGNDNALTRIAGLPTVVIHTKNAEDIVEKDVYKEGKVSFISADGTSIFSSDLDIKGRGNASWGFPKKPYRLKLSKKASVLGLPATAKNWTLINNYGDKTLMRNLLAFDLSKRLDIPYTPAGIPVNVFLNGEYKGCYQLCDQMEVGTERVNITEMKPTDIALPNLSGGYFIEIDAYAEGELPIAWFNSSKGVPVTIKSPKDDEIVQEQRNYIIAHFNKMETALFSANFKDTTTGYRKYLDVETFIRHFLVGEISGNTDTYWSTYMYKERNSDIFKFGPVWDFDIAFENDYRTYRINDKSDWIYKSEGSSAAGNARNMVNRIFEDAAFVNRLKVVYAAYRNNGKLSADSLAGVVNAYAAQLEEAQKLNFTRWNILHQKEHMNPATYGSYAGEVNNVRSYLTARIAWMDNKLNYVPTDTSTNSPTDPPTAIETLGATSLTLYPNPTTGLVHVDNARGAEILLYSLSGELLQRTRESTVDLSAYPNGAYLIKAGNKTAKVVKK
ncbi:hypothetical protein FACS1894156_7910 [Bacteroidia bacterium]|nr:hypothetical protein FACS1894156_7910 [Bacteroidia bacterium]